MNLPVSVFKFYIQLHGFDYPGLAHIVSKYLNVTQSWGGLVKSVN